MTRLSHHIRASAFAGAFLLLKISKTWLLEKENGFEGLLKVGDLLCFEVEAVQTPPIIFKPPAFGLCLRKAIKSHFCSDY